jgi:HlyD family secretion protein
MNKWLLTALLVIVAAILAGGWLSRPAGLPEGFAAGNGRIEATEIDIATQSPGRVREILAREGDCLTAGTVLARMDAQVLLAQQAEAQARVGEAENALLTVRSLVAQRESELAAAQALVGQHRAEAGAARQRLKHSKALVSEGAVSRQQVEEDEARLAGARAMISAAEAQVIAARAGITAAQSQVLQAQAVIEAAKATVARLQAEMRETELKAPLDGCVQYRIAETGEVLNAGGRVLSLVDLSDVYMTFFLPTEAAGQVILGSEIRLVLDALPAYVIPAKASFVASVAQFTPKTVETQTERLKLMFRVRARIDPQLLKAHPGLVKVGLPGMAYVRLNPRASWPEALAVRLPP